MWLAPVYADYTGPTGLIGTGGDLARFGAAFLAGGELDGKRILKAETVAMMLNEGYGGNDGPDGTAWASAGTGGTMGRSRSRATAATAPASAPSSPSFRIEDGRRRPRQRYADRPGGAHQAGGDRLQVKRRQRRSEIRPREACARVRRVARLRARKLGRLRPCSRTRHLPVTTGALSSFNRNVNRGAAS